MAPTTRSPLHMSLWIALTGYLWLLPVGGTIALRNLFFAVMLICFFAIYRKQWRDLDFLLWRQWAIYSSVIAISLTYAIDLSYSLGEIKPELLYPILLFWIGLNIVRNEAAYYSLVAILISSNLFLVAYSLMITATGQTTKDGLVGTLNAGVGTYSTYLITVMPLIALFAWRCWTNRQRARSLAVSALLLAGFASLYFTQNRQGVLVTIVEIGVVTALMNASRVLSWAKILPFVIALLVALIVFFAVSVNRAPAPENSPVSGINAVGESLATDTRWHLWQFTLREISRSPMTGGGFGQRVFRMKHPDFEPTSMLWHAHNMLLNKGVQMGVPGMLAFLLLFFSVPCAISKGLSHDSATRQIAIAGIAISLGVFLKNMTDDFFTRDCGYLYWIIIGATLGCIRGKLGNNKESA